MNFNIHEEEKNTDLRLKFQEPLQKASLEVSVMSTVRELRLQNHTTNFCSHEEDAV